MIKILHAADLHLDSAFVGRSEQAAERLRRELSTIPEKLADLCRKENCDILLLAGDLFDGGYTRSGYLGLKNALEDVKIPVFIAPGNHDFIGPDSPWQRELWSENVHIFTQPRVQSVGLPELDCRIYGAGFMSMDCPALLENFHLEGSERYHIGLFHGDPTQSNSPYNPISQGQVAASKLDYLALGHVHKDGQFRAGKTLCAWSGCPMGRGFDELGEKGALIVTLEDQVAARFVPLDTPRFYDQEIAVTASAEDAIAHLLPAAGSLDHYRITLQGECPPPDIPTLLERFSAFPNLELRDRTQPPIDTWGNAGADSLEGVYFRLLRQCYDEEDGESKEIALLAAKLSRKILDGSEVVLP